MKAAKVAVPDVIDQAITDAKRKPVFDLVDKARVSIETAESDEAWHAGVIDLATAFTVEIAGRSEQFTAVLDGYRQRAIYVAVREVSKDLFAELADTYNAAVPSFTEAVSRIPDRVNEIPAVDLHPDVSVAISEARTAATVLVPCWEAYRALASLTGHYDGGSSWTDQLDTVFLLSHPKSDQSATYAAVELSRLATNGQYGDLRPLEPHATLALFGDLELCQHPSQADIRRDNVGVVSVQPLMTVA